VEVRREGQDVSAYFPHLGGTHQQAVSHLRKVSSVLEKASLTRWWFVLSREHSSSVTDMLVRSFPLLQEVSRPPPSLRHSCSRVMRNSTFLDLWEVYDFLSKSRRSFILTTSRLVWEAEW